MAVTCSVWRLWDYAGPVSCTDCCFQPGRACESAVPSGSAVSRLLRLGGRNSRSNASRPLRTTEDVGTPDIFVRAPRGLGFLTQRAKPVTRRPSRSRDMGAPRPAAVGELACAGFRGPLPSLGHPPWLVSLTPCRAVAGGSPGRLPWTLPRTCRWSGKAWPTSTSALGPGPRGVSQATVSLRWGQRMGTCPVCLPPAPLSRDGRPVRTDPCACPVLPSGRHLQDFVPVPSVSRSRGAAFFLRFPALGLPARSRSWSPRLRRPHGRSLACRSLSFTSNLLEGRDSLGAQDLAPPHPHADRAVDR